MKKLFTLYCGLLLSVAATAGVQPSWNPISAREALANGPRETNVVTCKYFQADPSALWAYLQDAPMERSGKNGLEFLLPMADGSMQRFAIVNSPVMEAGLSAKYPMIRTWSGKGIDNPSAYLRMDITQWGFHAMISNGEETIFIDPVNLQATSTYMVYRKSDAIRSSSAMHACEFDANSQENKDRYAAIRAEVTANRSSMTQRSVGDILKTYRLALACTGEYATFYGGTVAGALSGMVTSVNRVNEVYEKELCIHLNLVANTDTLIYLNAGTDPYTNNSGSQMLGQNQTTCTQRIGTANYDIGHVFSTGGGGIAGLGVICISTQKARGVTGSPSPVADGFDIDYVAHEMGHQFGGNHTFNGTTGSCTGNVNTTTAYEPGSGSTIMAYAGICPGQDVQAHSDAYFHTGSFDEIEDYVTFSSGNNCDVTTPTGNNSPVILSTTANYNIPLLTPFRLTGSASDPDGDTIRYCWEEFDTGPSGAPTTPSGNAPLFRSLNNSLDSVRIFPKLTTILAGLTSASFERLPTYARSLKFRLTVRDNKAGGGGVVYEDVLTVLTVINTTTGFQVTTANTTGTSFPALSQQNITWDVSNTNNAPINTANVNILLSTDGGLTFPITLASSVPNTGSASVTIPNNQTTTARIMIEAVGNVYFDINNRNFTIGAPQSIYEAGIPGETINVFPNPAVNDINWSMTGKFRGEGTVTLTDMSGRTVYTSEFTKQETTVQHTISGDNLGAGVYMLNIETTAGHSVTKLVRQ